MNSMNSQPSPSPGQSPGSAPSSANPSFALRACTTFGLGYLRPASGTWGSMPPVAIAGVLLLASAPAWAITLTMAVIAIAFTWACIAGGDEAEARFNRKDPGQVVADETAGMALAMLWLPAQAFESPQIAIFTLVLCFLVFRILDILKPWPINGLQRIPGGWGIVIDDLLAGLLTLGIVHAAAWANAQRIASQLGT